MISFLLKWTEKNFPSIIQRIIICESHKHFFLSLMINLWFYLKKSAHLWWVRKEKEAKFKKTEYELKKVNNN